MGVNDLHRIMAGRDEHQDWPPTSIARIHELAKADASLAREKDDRSGWTPLHYGMKNGASGEAVQAVMAAYPKAADVVDNNGHTPLDLGLQEGAPADSIKALLDAYPSAAKAVDDSGRTSLHLAIHHGRVSGEAIKVVLAARPQSAKAKDSDLRTPLHLCMKKDAPPDAIQAVLDAFPKAAELEDGSGMTPLHAAIQNGASGDAIQTVLDVYPSAAKMEFQDGKHPLYRAIENGASAQALEALVEAYPEAASIKNNFGRTPLFLCLEKGLPSDSVKVILEAYPQGAEARDTNGYTPLHWAMGYGASPETIGTIMEAFPEAAGMQDKDGMSPLFVGMEKGVSVSSIMAVLVAYPPAVEMQDNVGSTPLRYGLLKGAPIEIIKGMLEAWPYAASVRDAKGFTPLMIHLRLIYDVEARNEAITREQIDIDTSMLKMIIERYPEAGEVEDVAGLSPISFLISLCLGASDFASLVCDDTGYRLQLLMKGIRDGRPLKKLCTTQKPVPLKMFFSLFDQSDGLEECEASMTPEIDLNQDYIPGWTMLEVLADIDNVEASNIIFQIVEEQKAKLVKGNKDNLITILCQDTSKSTVTFRSISVVSEETMRRVADRAKLSNSSERLKRWGEEYGRFMGKYRIDRNDRPKHRSYHCVVMFGTELVPSPEGDGRKVEERVALKFEADEDSFAREIQNRQFILNNSEEDGSPFVARIRAAYTTGTTHEESLREIPNVFFRKELSRDLAKFDHLLYLNPCGDSQERMKINHLMVMDSGGGDDLGDFISHQDICGKNLFHVLHAAISMARCLQFLNDDCGIVHQDVQPRNFVALENGTDFRAIDLDSATVVGSVSDDMGHNRSGYLPPEQALVEYSRLSKSDSSSEGSTDGEASSMSIGAKLEELENLLEGAPEEYRLFIKKEIDRITAEEDKCHNLHAPNEITAQSQYDMWGFGACLYELCTNKKLFRVDGTDDVVDDDELRKIATWDEQDMRKALQSVPSDFGWERIKLLLQLLLQPEPSDRPDSWRTIVAELEKGSLRENGNVRNLASITPAALTDIETVNCPFVFQFINDEDFRLQKAKSADPPDGDAVQLRSRLERAQALLEWASARVEDPTGSPACPSKSMLKNVLSSITGKKEEHVYLQLLCGWTLEPVITYQVPVPKYLDRAQKIAMFGAKSCSTGIKLSMSWNSGSRSARMFGYPLPLIPADVVEASTGFLEDLCSSIPVVELNLSNKEECTIRPSDFSSFARFLEDLEGTGKVCHLLGEFGEIDGSWEDALKREIVVCEGEKPQITFVSVREFARHGGCA